MTREQRGTIIIAICGALALAIVIILMVIVERTITADARSEDASVTLAARAGTCAPPAQWITSDDYPHSALRKAQEGTTSIQFTIGDNGRIASCRVAQSSGHDSLDQAACGAVMRRGCINLSDLPEERVMSRRVVWMIPS